MSRISQFLAILGSLAATVYFLMSHNALSPEAQVAFKGAAVGSLTLAAVFAARSTSGWMLVLVMALGAAGDVFMEFDQAKGGGAFALGHVVAIALYLRNRRSPAAMPASQKAAALALLFSAAVLVVFAGTAATPALALYAVLVAAMAASAWTSRFSRYRTGIGAVLFLVSDGIIFARIGGRIDPELAGWLIWPLYFLGQLLIFGGVRKGLQRIY